MARHAMYRHRLRHLCGRLDSLLPWVSADGRLLRRRVRRRLRWRMEGARWR